MENPSMVNYAALEGPATLCSLFLIRRSTRPDPIPPIPYPQVFWKIPDPIPLYTGLASQTPPPLVRDSGSAGLKQAGGGVDWLLKRAWPARPARQRGLGQGGGGFD